MTTSASATATTIATTDNVSVDLKIWVKTVCSPTARAGGRQGALCARGDGDS